MDNLLLSLKIQVNNKIYVKDPETSSLGRKIIQESIILIDEMGFENFTLSTRERTLAGQAGVDAGSAALDKSE